VPRKISSQLQERVRRRAGHLCEYCHTSELWQCVRFTIDHLQPISTGGEDHFLNLALACFHCNRRKGTKQMALDNLTGRPVPLFNPRQQSWAEHFIWSADGLRIVPLTAGGRATVALLDLNRERLLRIRAADVAVNRHPPSGDPRQSS
jgi:hypothetical protein